MAVHPADDGSLVIEDTSSTDPSRTSGPTGPAGTGALARTVVAVLSAVVILASLGVIGYGQLAGSDAGSSAAPDDQALRDAVMSTADQFVLRSNTYGPGDLDEANTMPGYAEAVREVITPKFTVSFDDSLTFAEQSVAEAGYARDVELYATGVESVDADAATVLVAGVINGTYPDTSAQAQDGDRVEFEPHPFRFKVEVVMSEGEWLVDDFSPLTSEIIDPTAPSPSPVPSDSPNGASTDAPSPGARS